MKSLNKIIAPVFLAIVHQACSAMEANELFNDWAYDDKLLCGGYYQPAVDPLETPSTDVPLEITADQSRVNLEGESLLWGHVLVTQGNRTLEADEAMIRIDKETRSIKQIEVTENVRYIQPGLQIVARTAEVSRERDTLLLSNTAYRFYLRQARGESEHVEVSRDRIIQLNNATYTACAPGHETWSLSASSVTLNPNTGRGTAKNSWLNLGSVPIFYFPYVQFPIDDRRQSGFLYPSFSNTTESGSIVAVPYYWNLASNYDALFTVRGIELRGVELQTLGRYLTPRHSGEVQVRFLPYDDAYEEFRFKKRRSHPTISNPNDPRLLGLKGGSRTAINAMHKSILSDQLTLNIDYHAVSDDNFYVDLEESIHSNDITNLNQEIKLSQKTAHWQNSLRFQEYQVLHSFDGPQRSHLYRRQPELSLRAYYPDVLDHLDVRFIAEGTRFVIRRDPLTSITPTHGDRFHLRPGLSFPFEASYAYFRPTVHLDITSYDLKLSTSDRAANRPDAPGRTIPIYDIRTGLFFERYLNFNEHSYLQTLEPEVAYLYIPYRDQNAYPIFDSGPREFTFSRLFSIDRFSGYDRIGDENRVTLALSSRVLDLDGKQERFEAHLGQGFYLSDRRVSLCDGLVNPACRLREDATSDDLLSPLVGEMNWQITNALRATGTLEWNHEVNERDKSGVSFAWRGKSGSVWNVGHEYLRIDPTRTNLTTGATRSLEQSSFSFYLPVHARWNVLGRWQYDHAENHLIDTLLGAEYNTCCAAFQLIGSRYLKVSNEESIAASAAVSGRRKYDNAFYFQVMLKGFSTFGFHGNDNKLKTLIPGYPSFQKRDQSKHYRG